MEGKEENETEMVGERMRYREDDSQTNDEGNRSPRFYLWEICFVASSGRISIALLFTVKESHDGKGVKYSRHDVQKV